MQICTPSLVLNHLINNDSIPQPWNILVKHVLCEGCNYCVTLIWHDTLPYFPLWDCLLEPLPTMYVQRRAFLFHSGISQGSHFLSVWWSSFLPQYCNNYQMTLNSILTTNDCVNSNLSFVAGEKKVLICILTWFAYSCWKPGLGSDFNKVSIAVGDGTISCESVMSISCTVLIGLERTGFIMRDANIDLQTRKCIKLSTLF